MCVHRLVVSISISVLPPANVCVTYHQGLMGAIKTPVPCNRHAGTNTIRHLKLLFKLLTQWVTQQCIIAAWSWVTEQNTHCTAPTDTTTQRWKSSPGTTDDQSKGRGDWYYFNHPFVEEKTPRRLPEDLFARKILQIISVIRRMMSVSQCNTFILALSFSLEKTPKLLNPNSRNLAKLTLELPSP